MDYTIKGHTRTKTPKINVHILLSIWGDFKPLPDQSTIQQTSRMHVLIIIACCQVVAKIIEDL